MSGAKFLGTGMHVPERVVPNRELSELMDTSDSWIRERTGIQERRYVEPGTGASDLALVASRQAIEAAGIEPPDLDLIVLATLSPDYNFPGSAVLLQEKLGVSAIGALDVRNQCSGFIYGLAVADAFMRTKSYRHILLVGTEVHSTGLDFSTAGREVAVLFGDGAGAVVLGPAGDGGTGVQSIHLHAQGEYASRLWLEAPASRYQPRIDEQMLRDGRHYPKMEGRAVFKHAVRRFPEAIREALAPAGLGLEDVDLFVLHQANLRILEAVAAAMDVPMEKFFCNIQRYGNTTAASIPIALHEAVQEGRIREGNRVILAAFGSGFTWASALVIW
jgi:3-oxoacyl-[acyl-carrier-protein] synthase-3